ncbi:BQ5605_C010g06008 [Microbotryum silenes-dioicae]|uniref:BQ5605_C010g06008 protein n=1 Tax=Microbotryum silenes-dioicae TaxID=796604 RepID=A0A2X0LTL9_9BASI|nr:BQ5605_C010g06008 [Microbotryum silenes-dioicae]
MGTKGSAELLQLNVWHYEKGDKGCWTDELTKGERASVEDVPPFTSQLKNFVGVCRGQEVPGCSASDAIRTMRTMEALLHSARTGQPVVIGDETH